MTTPQSAAGAEWRAELERWHAELANTIDQAALWAREFHVRTGDGRCSDASAPPSYPLLGYAERLETIGATLKMVCANASLDPPVLSWDRTTLRKPMIRIPGRDPDWRAADYSEGGQYLLYIRPNAPGTNIVTAQQHWRAALGFAAPSVLESHLGIPQLAVYAEQAQALFNIAYDTIRAAFRGSVAATFGRIWATGTTRSDFGARALVAWLQALTDWGCSAEECEAVLRDIEVVDPESVAICRAASWWLRDTA